MRLIKVKKSSRPAEDADLDDCLVVEVSELAELSKKNTRSSSNRATQGRKTVRKSNNDQFSEPSEYERSNSENSRKSKKGRPFNPQKNDSQDRPSAGDIYNRGVYLLSMREHSVKELTDKLSQKFPTSDEIASAVQKLSENDYVSDDRFTEAYVRHRTNRGFGPMKIRAELYRKGIKNKLIDEYLDLDSPVWAESALAEYLKKFGDSKVENYKDWARRARFLQGRGYNSTHIEYSVPEIKGRQ